MLGWDSYRAVYGAELRAAALEFADHGWPVLEASPIRLLLLTGRALDVLEVPAGTGRGVCGRLRRADVVVPVAATSTGSWWFPMSAGAELPPVLHGVRGVVLRGVGDAVLAPPSREPDGWVYWRVPPAISGYRVAAADLILNAAAHEVLRGDHADDEHPGAQRPAGAVIVGTR